MIKKFYIKLQVDIPEELASQINPDCQIIEGIIRILKNEIEDSCKVEAEITTEDPTEDLKIDLLAATTDLKIYKTAFKQLKKFVENYPILDEDKEHGDKYLNGKLGAMMDVAKKIDEIEIEQGLAPYKQNKKEGI